MRKSPILLALVLATSCAGAQSTAQQQAPAAVACLPGAITAIIDCSAKHDHACVVAAVAALVVCWVSHQPAPSSLPATPVHEGSGVSQRAGAADGLYGIAVDHLANDELTRFTALTLPARADDDLRGTSERLDSCHPCHVTHLRPLHVPASCTPAL